MAADDSAADDDEAPDTAGAVVWASVAVDRPPLGEPVGAALGMTLRRCAAACSNKKGEHKGITQHSWTRNNYNKLKSKNAKQLEDQHF